MEFVDHRGTVNQYDLGLTMILQNRTWQRQRAVLIWQSYLSAVVAAATMALDHLGHL